LELSHELDYLRWIFGEVEWVSATLSKQSNLDIDVEDTVHITLGFAPEYDDHQLIGVVNLDFIRHDTSRLCIAIGEKGSLRWNGLTGKIDIYEAGANEWKGLFSYNHHRDESYRAEWADFLECVAHNKSPLVTGEDGLKVLEIVKSAQEVVFSESFETAFFKELNAPSKDFLKIIHRNMTFSTKFNEETLGKMINQINSSFLKSIYDKKVIVEANSNSQGVITTEYEIQAYHVIRTLLLQNKKISKDRIGYKDFKGFFNISVDDSSKKVICRLIFNDKSMKIVIENNEYLLEHIDDVMKYKNELTNRTILLLE
jgi:hypothetical protein